MVFNLLFSVIYVYQPLLLISSLGSLIVGIFGAVKQVRIKRFLAYTSISQVGFILLGVSCGSVGGLVASIVYLFIYTISSLVLFSIFLNIQHISNEKPILYLCELYFFSSNQLKGARFLSIVILSMSGIPPFAGFLGKLLIYFALMEVSFDLTIITTMFLSIISSYYYLNFLHYLWFVKYNQLRLFFFTSTFFFDFTLQCFSSILVFFVFIFPNIYFLALNLALSCLWPFSFF